MSAETSPPPTQAAEQHAHGRWAGRSGLVLALLMFGLGVYLTAGVLLMDVPEGAENPGPTFVPIILAVLCFLLAALLTVQLWRHPEPPTRHEAVDEYGGEGHRTFSDWRSLGTVLAGFLAFTLLLESLGWILAAALLFWSVAWAMGSRRGARDVAIALVFSCAIQAGFSAGLGLHLPPGILNGVF